MDDKFFRELCAAGDVADQKLLPSYPKTALAEYKKIFQKMMDSKEVDSFVIAKLTLGMMIAEIKLKNYKGAFDIWTAGEDSMLCVGIRMIENAALSENDTILYLQIEAFLNSLSAGDKPQAARNVNSFAEKVCLYCEEKNRPMLAGAVQNWRKHLNEVFENNIPPEYLTKLAAFEARLPGTPAASEFRMLAPSKWEITW